MTLRTLTAGEPVYASPSGVHRRVAPRVGAGVSIVKRMLAALLITSVIGGCAGKKPAPASRLVQPAGEFSFVTPDGWYRSKLPGIDFVIVSADADYGASPNIFVEGAPRPGVVRNRATQMTEANRAGVPAYASLEQDAFSTESGLTGLKVSARRENRDALPLALWHYLFQDGNRVIVLTCSCAEPVKQKYEPVFDLAMRSLRTERSDEAGSGVP